MIRYATCASLAPQIISTPKKGYHMAGKSSWFDEASNEPIINEQAQRLQSFLDTMADGVVDEHELLDQEKRLVDLMREIEPQLSEELHEKVTRLLCELTAYDIMQSVYTMQQLRPKAAFEG